MAMAPGALRDPLVNRVIRGVQWGCGLSARRI